MGYERDFTVIESRFNILGLWFDFGKPCTRNRGPRYESAMALLYDQAKQTAWSRRWSDGTKRRRALPTIAAQLT